MGGGGFIEFFLVFIFLNDVVFKEINNCLNVIFFYFEMYLFKIY